MSMHMLAHELQKTELTPGDLRCAEFLYKEIKFGDNQGVTEIFSYCGCKKRNHKVGLLNKAQHIADQKKDAEVVAKIEQKKIKLQRSHLARHKIMWGTLAFVVTACVRTFKKIDWSDIWKK